MKNSTLILLMALFLKANLWAQNPIWSLPDKYWDGQMLFPLPPLLSPYSANHNAYPAPDGSLGFYVVDEYVYDGSGALIGAMWLPTAVELL